MTTESADRDQRGYGRPEKMMEEFDCWLIRFFKVVITGILLIAYLLGVGQWISPEQQRSIARFPEAERDWSGERHPNKGIYAVIIENGEQYFYRDGKKYKL
jgi:hypothetical protein